MIAQVRAAILSDFSNVARECGLDPQTELHSAGLDLCLLTNPEMLMPAPSLALLLENSAAHSGRQDFAIRLASRRTAAHLGPTSLVITQQRTVRRALAMMERYRHLLNNTLYPMIAEDNGRTVIRCHLVFPGAMLAVQASQLSVAVIVEFFRFMISPNWSPISVSFAHNAPDDLTTHRGYFNCPVCFGQKFNGFVCENADLEREIPSAQPALANHASALLDQLPSRLNEDIVERLRTTLVLLLPSGHACIRTAAHTMGISIRTLQRALDARSTSFSGILRTLRRELAFKYLSDETHSIAEIAEMLDYASAPAFVRWFQQDQGIPPGHWRQQLCTNRAEQRRRGLDPKPCESSTENSARGTKW